MQPTETNAEKPLSGRVEEERCRSTVASPLVELDVQISRIRLSRKLSLLGGTRVQAHLAEPHSQGLR